MGDDSKSMQPKKVSFHSSIVLKIPNRNVCILLLQIVRADSFFTKNGTKNENSLFTSSGQSMADDFALRNDLQVRYSIM